MSPRGSSGNRQQDLSGERCAVGIDIGTSAVKATLVGESGRTFDAISEAYLTAHPHHGHAEQDPDDWWRAVGHVLDELMGRARISPERTAIGLTGQMHTAVLRDDTGRSLRPAILWSDERAQAEAATLSTRESRWAEIAGNPPIPAFTASHLAWLETHEPWIWERISSVDVLKDDVRRRLTGVRATEPSDASGTAMLDIRTDEWSHGLLEAVGVPSEWLAPVSESARAAGEVLRVPGTSAALIGVPVVAGAGDQAAQALALDVVEDGDVGVSLGSSGAAFASVATPRAGQSFRHGLPSGWLALDSSHAAGTALRWWSDIVGTAVPELGDAPVAADAPVFLPHIQGHRGVEGPPAGLVGLRIEHQRVDLSYSILEGVAVEMARLVRNVSSGPLPATVRLGGRAGQLEVIRRVMATLLDRPVSYSPRGPSFGAARLAAQLTGWEEQLVRHGRDGSVVTEPEPELEPVLTDRLGTRAEIEARLEGA